MPSLSPLSSLGHVAMVANSCFSQEQTMVFSKYGREKKVNNKKVMYEFPVDDFTQKENGSL